MGHIIGQAPEKTRQGELLDGQALDSPRAAPQDRQDAGARPVNARA